VELLLEREGAVVDRNVYWLSTQPDVVDWPQTLEKPQATMSQYADLSALQSLAPAHLKVTASSRREAGPDGADTATDVTITNTSSAPAVAFFLRADIRRGSASGAPAAGDNEVLPVFWSSNDVTLWPGESQTLHAAYRAASLHGEDAVVSVGGWNVATSNIPAGGEARGEEHGPPEHGHGPGGGPPSPPQHGHQHHPDGH
jgi:exo-1,4-beta-D-glucosaminidase